VIALEYSYIINQNTLQVESAIKPIHHWDQQGCIHRSKDILSIGQVNNCPRTYTSTKDTEKVYLNKLGMQHIKHCNKSMTEPQIS
jgi:hypothetical protein